jgi:hypothetical protein
MPFIKLRTLFYSIYTDQKDKALGIYNNIFFDIKDLHNEFNKSNYYGPILFVYSTDVLDQFDDIEITQNNPCYWNNQMQDQEKYIQNFEDLEKNIHEGYFSRHSIMITNKDKVNFRYLEKIIVDRCNNRNTKGENYSEMAVLNLKELIQKEGMKIPVCFRKCNSSCQCHNVNDYYIKVKFC